MTMSMIVVVITSATMGVIIMRPGLAEAKRGDRAESGIKAQWKIPTHFHAPHDQTVIAKKSRDRHLGINKIPAVDVLVIDRAEASEVLATLDLETAGDVDDFPEEFLQFAFPVARAVLIEKVVGETFEIFGLERNRRLDRLGGK